MILRGAAIRRTGHGKCGLLPNRTLSSSRAELQSPGVLVHRGIALYTLRSLFPASGRAVQRVPDWKDRKPFHATRARCRAVCLPRA